MIAAAWAVAAQPVAQQAQTSWWSYITPEGVNYILAALSAIVIGVAGVMVTRWRRRLNLDPETQDAVRRRDEGSEPPASLNAALSTLGRRLGDVEDELASIRGKLNDAIVHIDRLEAWGDAGWARVRGHKPPRPVRPASLRVDTQPRDAAGP